MHYMAERVLYTTAMNAKLYAPCRVGELPTLIERIECIERRVHWIRTLGFPSVLFREFLYVREPFN